MHSGLPSVLLLLSFFHALVFSVSVACAPKHPFAEEHFPQQSEHSEQKVPINC